MWSRSRPLAGRRLPELPRASGRPDGAHHRCGEVLHYVRPRLKAVPVDFASRHLVLRHSDKRAVLMHATIEEIEAKKLVIEEQAKEKMEKAIETVQTNFNTVRTGRANPSMLHRIEVEYYGTPVKLKSIAQISTPDATSLLIQPYDKSSLKLIEKTIVAANLGVTPSNDGEVIRVTVPPLTSDRRKFWISRRAGDL